jgi:Cof subfamily protein (haloacid dehalogenase superfamily)
MNLDKKIRAVCTDIDGTLLDNRRELSDRTITAIQLIRAKVPVILASSRMPAAMRHLQKEMGIETHPMICFNGGYIIWYEGESDIPHVIDSVSMPLSLCTAIIALATNTNIHISMFAADQWHTPCVDQWTERESTITKVSPEILELQATVDKWAAKEQGVHKVMCMGADMEIAALYKALNETFSDQIHIYRSKPTYLEIAPKIISKATALRLLMKNTFNIDLSEVMAFGDNYNDIDMIREVGFGVAVGNAIPEVKAVAKRITLNSKEDGVAAVIESFSSEIISSDFVAMKGK